jgi:hypothetical protein
MICEYCKKEFKTSSSLNLHIKTAKYCLKIQNDLGINNVNIEQYKCFVCGKIYSYKQRLIIHLNQCTNLYNLNLILKDKNSFIENLEMKIKSKDIEIKSKDIEIKLIRDEQKIYKKDHEFIYELAKQPKNIINTNNTNNNKINIISPLDLKNVDKLKNIINDNYKLDYIFSGQKGIAKFAVEHILKDDEGNPKYICTDPSRQIFKYKDENGEVRKDLEAKKLTNFLVEGGIKDKACDMMNEWWTEETGITNTDKFELLVDKAESLKALDSDNTEFKKELATMTTI